MISEMALSSRKGVKLFLNYESKIFLALKHFNLKKKAFKNSIS